MKRKIMFNEDDADQIFYDVVNATLSHKIYNEKKLDEKSLEIAEKMKKEYFELYVAHALILHEYCTNDNQNYYKLSDQIQDTIAEIVETYL